jgi:hypothetical protein
MHDDAAVEVAFLKARPNARRVTCRSRLVAREVQRSHIGRKPRKRLEELEDPFLRQPVGDGEERGSTPIAEIQRGAVRKSRHVPSGGDDSNPRPREPGFDELIREMLTRRDQDVGSSQREPIEPCLDTRANSAVVDSAGRLMEHRNQRNGGTACCESRTGERSGDRVEQKGARPEADRPTKHCCTAKSGERERPVGKGEEDDPRLVRRRRVRHSPVVQVAAAQAAGIAQRDEWENEVRVVHDTEAR